jgi:hypothetical protein
LLLRYRDKKVVGVFVRFRAPFNDLLVGTYRMFTQIYKHSGIVFMWI